MTQTWHQSMIVYSKVIGSWIFPLQNIFSMRMVQVKSVLISTYLWLHICNKNYFLARCNDLKTSQNILIIVGKKTLKFLFCHKNSEKLTHKKIFAPHIFPGRRHLHFYSLSWLGFSFPIFITYTVFITSIFTSDCNPIWSLPFSLSSSHPFFSSHILLTIASVLITSSESMSSSLLVDQPPF